jgi:hypothetical protein
LQYIDVTQNEIRFRDDAQIEPAMAGEFFQNAARDFITALCGLVGIGRCANGDGFAWFYLRNS